MELTNILEGTVGIKRHAISGFFPLNCSKDFITKKGKMKYRMYLMKKRYRFRVLFAPHNVLTRKEFYQSQRKHETIFCSDCFLCNADVTKIGNAKVFK